MVVSQNYGYLFCGRHNEGYSNLGFILGFPDFANLPNSDLTPTIEKQMEKSME